MPSTIELNSVGFDVENWQLFLISQNLLNDIADGQFGQHTLAATKQFQADNNLAENGVVDSNNYDVAMPLGLSDILDQRQGMDSPDWPPKPGFPPLVSNNARQAIFGAFTFVPDPLADDPENIRITNDWETDNIIDVAVPQLRKVNGESSMQFHKLGANQLIKLWADWETAGLLHFVRSWDGSFDARFVRGSQTTLSNHSFGSAFDINVAWNEFGDEPALVGQKGSTRELVAIANANGFYWGGHFSKQDGMHFEVAKLM